MELSFWGGAGEVTGSRHRLSVEGVELLLDCGLFQGHRGEAIAKNRHIPFELGELDAVLLSHAHVDHSGGLPLLAKGGYGGPIFATEPTADLCQIMLMDAAHLQVQDAAFFNKVHADDNRSIDPLYDEDDAARALRLFQGRRYGQAIELGPRLRARFHNAGHVLGSAMVEVEADGPRGRRRLLFTGDLGRRRSLLMDPPRPPEGVDYLMIESTYGSREHDPAERVEERLREVIERAVKEKGKILIPSFALERTQEIVYVLERLRRRGAIPPIPVYVDSPMAVSISVLFNRHMEAASFSSEFKAYASRVGDPFGLDSIKYVRSLEESKALNDAEGPMVILSASGMCEGGRILHHLRNNLGKDETTILIVGYQANGTLGRRLADGAKRVKIFGLEHQVWARVERIDGLSAHADRNDLVAFVTAMKPRPRRVFLVHGDAEDRAALARLLDAAGVNGVERPGYGERYRLD